MSMDCRLNRCLIRRTMQRAICVLEILIYLKNIFVVKNCSFEFNTKISEEAFVLIWNLSLYYFVMIKSNLNTLHFKTLKCL